MYNSNQAYQQPQQTGYYNPGQQGNVMMPQMTGYNPSFGQQQQPQQHPQLMQNPGQQPLYANPTGMGFGNSFNANPQSSGSIQPPPPAAGPSLSSGYLNSQATGMGMNMNANVNMNSMPQLSSQQTGFYNNYQTASSISVPAPQTAPEAAPPLPTRPSNSTTSAPSKVSISSAGGAIDVPNVRLSFITADDQQKFATLFKAALTPGQHALTGDQARDILVKSNLSPITLSKIWRLVDITKAGSLMFPNFALAMYLCDLAIKNKPVPASLSDTIKNEVSSLIDIISFSIPEESNLAQMLTSNPTGWGLPDFTVGASANPIMAQPTGAYQLQSQLTGGQGLQYPQQQQQQQQQQPLQSQLTGGQGFQSQFTGGQGLQSQLTGGPTLQSQFTGGQGLQSQLTGGQGLQSQLTGGPTLQSQFTGGQGLQSQPTGYLQSQPTGYLQSQPTGKPGQWGFINTPTGGLPGIDALRTQFMPQVTGIANTGSLQQLQGNATVEWAITKDEKKIYDDIFRAWDKTRRGYIDGENAIKVFSQSGLNRGDLEAIWNLSDPSNKGKLDRDEFAVAMHLIYRNLNGYPIPARLPAELIPPSSRNFSESVNQIKSYLKSEPTGGPSSMSLSAQKTGGSVSYLKNRSFKGTNENAFKKDATVFKNNDNEASYVSSSRHKSRHKDQTQSSSSPSSSFSSSSQMSIADLKKAIREKQILLDAIDTRDDQDNADMSLEKSARDSIDQLHHRIRNIQNDINRHESSSSLSSKGNTAAERRQLLTKLQLLADKLPQLTSSVQKTEDEIARAKLALFRLKAEKENPGATIVGTGPNGTVTESDRKKAKQKALLQSRMAALTGKPAANVAADFEDFESRYAAEESHVLNDHKTNMSMISDVEASVLQMKNSLDSVLRDTSSDIQADRDHRRWVEAIGVEDEVREFIASLESSRPVESNIKKNASSSTAYDQQQQTPARSSRTLDLNPSSPAATPNNTVEDSATRSARIKAMAVKRMNEKLAALGISRTTKSPNAFVAPVQSEPQVASPVVFSPVVSSPVVSSPVVSSPVVSSPVFSSPAPVSTAPPVISRARRAPAPSPAPASAPVPAPMATPVVADSDSSDSDSDDEEYKALLEQKRAEEERIRKIEAEQQRKASAKEEKKRAKKEALKAEMAAIKARETAIMANQNNDNANNNHINEDSDRETYEFVESPTPASDLAQTQTQTQTVSDASGNNNPFFKPPQPAATGVEPVVVAPVPTHVAIPSAISSPVVTPVTTNHTDSNPFHYQQRLAGQATGSRASETSSASSIPVIDAKEAANQRAMQRGQVHDNDDDDWGKSTDDEDSSDDEMSGSRASSANLASMLFRGMAPQRTGSNLSQMESPPVIPAPADTLAAAIDAPVDAAISEYSTPREVSPPIPVAMPVPTAEATDESVETTTPTGAAPPPPIPSFPTGAPPPPPMPSFPTGAPPPPPMPSFPTGAPPPPPMPSFPTGAPPPPPPAGMPPVPTAAPAAAPAMGGIDMLLGEIQAGRSLRKVDDSQKHVSENAVAGRVL